MKDYLFGYPLNIKVLVQKDWYCRYGEKPKVSDITKTITAELIVPPACLEKIKEAFYTGEPLPTFGDRKAYVMCIRQEEFGVVIAELEFDR